MPLPVTARGSGEALIEGSRAKLQPLFQWRSQELYGEVFDRTGGCGRGCCPLLVQLGGMGERCKLPHRGLGRSPRSFIIMKS